MNQKAKLCDERQKEKSFCSSNTGWWPRVFLKRGRTCLRVRAQNLCVCLRPTKRAGKASHVHVLIGCAAERGGAPRRRVCAEARSQMLLVCFWVWLLQCGWCVNAAMQHGRSKALPVIS